MGVVHGKSVWITYWNGEFEKDLHQVEHEMMVDCYVATSHAEVMEMALPRLVGVGMDDWIGAVLVIECFGKTVKCDRKCILYVGGKRQSETDCELIREAAISDCVA